MADDPRSDDLPQPDAPADAAERAQAESFAQRVESLLAGAEPPALMSADERELLEVTSMLRAGYTEVTLPADRTRALIDAALGSAPAAAPNGGSTEAPSRAPASGGSVTALRRPRGRMARALPWSIASVAAAAAVLLAITRPPPAAPVDEQIVVSVSVPDHQRSRSADPLVGRIPAAAAADASSRIDMIYADRLDGFRERRFAAAAPARPHSSERENR
jgi:hypothetical protein